MEQQLTVESLKFLSHAMHSLQGGAFLITALTAGYVCDRPESRLKMFIPLSLLLAGMVSLAAVPAVLSGWNLPAAWEILASKRLFLFLAAVSFLCIGAGLAETLSFQAAGGRTWGRVSSVFLLACAGIYLAVHIRVHPEAARHVRILHMGIGIPLAAAAAVRLIESIWTSKPLRLAWLALLMMASIQLLTYREPDKVFALRTVTMYQR